MSRVARCANKPPAACLHTIYHIRGNTLPLLTHSPVAEVHEQWILKKAGRNHRLAPPVLLNVSKHMRLPHLRFHHIVSVSVASIGYAEFFYHILKSSQFENDRTYQSAIDRKKTLIPPTCFSFWRIAHIHPEIFHHTLSIHYQYPASRLYVCSAIQ